MFEDIFDFMTNWLGNTNGLQIPIPFTDSSIDFVVLMSVGLLVFCVCWILYFICKIINLIFKIF